MLLISGWMCPREKLCLSVRVPLAWTKFAIGIPLAFPSVLREKLRDFSLPETLYCVLQIHHNLMWYPALIKTKKQHMWLLRLSFIFSWGEETEGKSYYVHFECWFFNYGFQRISPTIFHKIRNHVGDLISVVIRTTHINRHVTESIIIKIIVKM